MKTLFLCSVGALVAFSTVSKRMDPENINKNSVQVTDQNERTYVLSNVGPDEVDTVIGVSSQPWVKVTTDGRDFWINLDRAENYWSRDFMEAAYVAEMTSALMNFAIAEESYFAYNVDYVTDINLLDLTTSDDVTLNIDGANDTGYRATAKHMRTTTVCFITVGSGGFDTFDVIDDRDDARPVCMGG